MRILGEFQWLNRGSVSTNVPTIQISGSASNTYPIMPTNLLIPIGFARNVKVSFQCRKKEMGSSAFLLKEISFSLEYHPKII